MFFLLNNTYTSSQAQTSRQIRGGSTALKKEQNDEIRGGGAALKRGAARWRHEGILWGILGGSKGDPVGKRGILRFVGQQNVANSIPGAGIQSDHYTLV